MPFYFDRLRFEAPWEANFDRRLEEAQKNPLRFSDFGGSEVALCVILSFEKEIVKPAVYYSLK